MDSNAINLNQGTYGEFANVIDHSYYDRLTLVAAGTSFPLFQVPLSGTVGAAVKTIADTNNPLGGMIPKGQLFKIFSIKASFLSHAVKATADIDTFLNWLGSAVLSLSVLGKAIMFQRPLFEVMGIPIAFHVTPAATLNELQMSVGEFRNGIPLNIPIILAEQTPYEVRIDYPTALGGGNALLGDFIRISLDGILFRRS